MSYYSAWQEALDPRSESASARDLDPVAALEARAEDARLPLGPPHGPAPEAPRARSPQETTTTAPRPAPPGPAPFKLRYDVDSMDNRDPWFLEQVARVVETVMAPYHRTEIEGLDRIPRGGALYVGNHSGGPMTIDTFLFGIAVYRAHGIEAVPHALAHDLPLKLPFLHQVFTKLGALRASPENARRLFEAGHKVLVYPGGDQESMRPFRDRNRVCFFGHRGYIRTALKNDVPIVPVVAQGSHSTFVVLDDARWLAKLVGVDRLLRMKVWPVTLSLPWGLTFFPPPLYIPLPARIRIEVLPPVYFERAGEAAASDEDYVAECARRVETRMQASMDRLAAK